MGLHQGCSLQELQEYLYHNEVRNNEITPFSYRDGLNKPISNARDTQEVPFEQGKYMMELIESYPNTNTILEHFEYYDLRQENYDRHYNPQ